MTTPRFARGLAITLLLLAPAAAFRAQAIWTENFNNGCASNCLANGYNGWTVVDNFGGVSGSAPNNWYVSCAEEGITPPGCGSICIGDQSLHIGNGPGSGGDMGAGFNETGVANATYRLAISPTISTAGYYGLTLKFDFIAFGSAGCSDDRAMLFLSTNNGATWPVGLQNCLTSVCCGACNGYSLGQWTTYSVQLPSVFDNNPNVRIGFHWRNNGNGTGTDPSVAIDDIRLEMPTVDFSITKSDGVTEATPGGTVTYTLAVMRLWNPFAPDSTGVGVTDNFPAGLSGCSTTCVPTGGATCTPGPYSGNINDTISLPSAGGGQATYTSVCTVSPSASGSLVNTATVSVPGGIYDPNLANNSATDTDTVLAILGEVPDRASRGTPLTVVKNGSTPAHLNLAWGDSCGGAQTDFAVYEGTLGTWYSHASKLCTTGGAFSVTDLTPAAGNTYFLVIARSASAEGSFGNDSAGAPIPRGTGACAATWDTASCASLKGSGKSARGGRPAARGTRTPPKVKP